MNQNSPRQEIISSFSLNISLEDCEEEIAYWIEREARIKLAVRHMLAGNISGAEVLQICDQCVPNTDNFLDTVAENILELTG